MALATAVSASAALPLPVRRPLKLHRDRRSLNAPPGSATRRNMVEAGYQIFHLKRRQLSPGLQTPTIGSRARAGNEPPGIPIEFDSMLERLTRHGMGQARINHWDSRRPAWAMKAERRAGNNRRQRAAWSAAASIGNAFSPAGDSTVAALRRPSISIQHSIFLVNGITVRSRSPLRQRAEGHRSWRRLAGAPSHNRCHDIPERSACYPAGGRVNMPSTMRSDSRRSARRQPRDRRVRRTRTLSFRTCTPVPWRSRHRYPRFRGCHHAPRPGAAQG